MSAPATHACRKLTKEGDAVVLHGLRGRASNRKIGRAMQGRAIELLKQPDWHDFGPTFASEQLAKRHGIAVSDEKPTVMAVGCRSEIKLFGKPGYLHP